MCKKFRFCLIFMLFLLHFISSPQFQLKSFFHRFQITLIVTCSHKHRCICIPSTNAEHIGKCSKVFLILVGKIQNSPLDFPDSLRIVIIFSKLQRNIQCIQINTFIFCMVSAQMKPKKKVSMRKVIIPRIHYSPYSDHVFQQIPIHLSGIQI